ncbi:hypothetical protein G6R29_01230 [Fructobacillus sp. M2-14]|uniref:Uncharacterized protein n=1 Tax=Fructobacillus broussonetiae TaxID=2713173 RepID=A0ABS5QZ76_9LACO|nr:hypothetical protein [Fructobacillus broussonetiae]MBS9338257.1 hypothetical protein [Fructobacillus broussonetiae]
MKDNNEFIDEKFELAKNRKIEILAGDLLDTRKIADLILFHFLDNDKEKYPDIWNDDPEEIAAFNREIGLFVDEKEYGREKWQYD